MPITTDFVLDTNILLRIPFDKASAPTEASQAYIALLAQGFAVGTTVANLAEFANVATRPVMANGVGLSSAQAQARIRTFEGQLAVFSESIESYEIWKRLLAQYEVRGRQVHDARIVAIMLQEGIRNILTFNTPDFARFPEIVTLHPDQILKNS
jgi:predicted nucleic acid-binding protein